MSRKKQFNLYKILILLTRCVRLIFRLACLYPSSALLYNKKSRRDNPGTDSLLVIYSQVAWWGVWQRPQEQALGLVENRPILYVSPVQAHEPMFRYQRWKRMHRLKKGQGVRVFSPLILPGHYKWEPVFFLNRLLILAELRWLLKNEHKVDLFTNSPFVDHLIRGLAPDRVTYDVIDDFAAFDWAPKGAELMEQSIFQRADTVMTGTRSLLEQKKKYYPEAEFIPCGVAFERFYRPPGNKPLPKPDDIKNLPGPMIGYVGTLSERIDTELIQKVAESYPEASIVLVGPVHRSLNNPPEGDNIHYLGLKKHEELPAYLNHFKVALLPFRLTRAAKAVNPVKTLEYLAAGCLVVSTAIPDVIKFYSDVVIIAHSHEEFIEKIGIMLKESQRERVNLGIERAKKASWEKMIEKMEKLMDKSPHHSHDKH